MKKVYILSLGGIIFFIVGYFIYYNSGPGQTIKETPQTNVLGEANLKDIPAQQALWSNRIKEVGTKTAYNEFKQVYQKEDFGAQHLAAHMFGALLYETDGIKGVTVCDSSFAFGCFHSFFGSAIAREGTQALAELDTLCLQNYGIFGTGCQHGIGHGILEYEGHSKLLEALNECKKTTQKNPLFGCTSGVFMEYNTPLVLDDLNTSAQPRPLDRANPYAPCPSLTSKAFRLSCYNEIGQWWDQYFGYKEMGELCAKLKDPNEQEVCFESIGGVAAVSAKYAVAETIASCNEMPNSTGKLMCRSGAAWALYAEPTQKMNAPEICNGIEQRSRCLQKAVIICNYIEDTSLEAQCRRDNIIGG